MRTIAMLLSLCFALGAHGADPERRERGLAIAAKAVEFLRAQQDESGGWGVNPQGPKFPAITGLVVQGLLGLPGADPRDESVARGAAFMLSFQQPDGGIYDRILPSYNTAICLSALVRIDSPEARAAIAPAREFLKGLQYGEDARRYEALPDESAQVVPGDHPFYGGVGYGRAGRPDLSNLQWVLEALRDSGVESTDAAFQRALVFLQRCQMDDRVNDMEFARGSRQGGFVYSTSPGGDRPGQGQSMSAGLIEETLTDGTRVSRLRAYGSMTYSGFKSYMYAGLGRDDLRVRLALDWIRRNYTLAGNPGMGADGGPGAEGMYYYFVVFARALHTLGDETLEVISGDREERRAWANDLIDRLGELQNEDGSFRAVDQRWMENNPVLITAYALIALGHALDSK